MSTITRSRYWEQQHGEPPGSYLGITWLAEQEAARRRDDSINGFARYRAAKIRSAILDARRRFHGWRRGVKTFSIEGTRPAPSAAPDDTVEWLLRPAGLPTKARKALLMKRDGHQVTDIAAALGISETMASRHLRDGRRILAARYERLTGTRLDPMARIPVTFRRQQ